MRIQRRGVSHNAGWDDVVAKQVISSARWDARSGEFFIITMANKDPNNKSRYHHEVRFTLSDFVVMLKLIANGGIEGSPEMVRDAMATKSNKDTVDSLIKLLSCSSGYIPTILPGAVAVKKQN